MATREEEFNLPVDEGEMVVFLYEPEGAGPLPSIIMVHDAIGLTAAAREQASWRAGHGYAVAALDVFHRAGRLLTTAGLGGGPEATLQIRAGMTNDGHYADITRLAAFLRERPGSNGRVGLTGFCLGGRISFLGATLGDVIDATVAFYPTRLLESDPAIPGSPWPIHGAGNVTNPLLMFFPGAGRLQSILLTSSPSGQPSAMRATVSGPCGWRTPTMPSRSPRTRRTILSAPPRRGRRRSHSSIATFRWPERPP